MTSVPDLSVRPVTSNFDVKHLDVDSSHDTNFLSRMPKDLWIKLYAYLGFDGIEALSLVNMKLRVISKEKLVSQLRQKYAFQVISAEDYANREDGIHQLKKMKVFFPDKFFQANNFLVVKDETIIVGCLSTSICNDLPICNGIPSYMLSQLKVDPKVEIKENIKLKLMIAAMEKAQELRFDRLIAATNRDHTSFIHKFFSTLNLKTRKKKLPIKIQEGCQVYSQWVIYRLKKFNSKQALENLPS